MTYISFILEYNIPVSPKELTVVMGAITSDIILSRTNRYHHRYKKKNLLNKIEIIKFNLFYFFKVTTFFEFHTGIVHLKI